MKPTRDITDPRVIKALGHPLRLRILAVLDDRVASPSELASEFNSPIGNVSYHVRILEALGLIRLVRTTPKRGAIEHHYEAVARPLITDETWSRIPDSVKRALVGAALDHAGRLARTAAAAGGFNRPEAHVSRTSLVLDEEGWKELSNELNAARARFFEISQESETRVREHGETGDGAMLLAVSFEPSTVPDESEDRRRPRARGRRPAART